MALLRRVGTFAKRSGEYVDNTVSRAGNRVVKATNSTTVKLGALAGGAYGAGKGFDAWQSAQESEATQAYMEARQAIMNDPNLTPEEKQRRIEQLRQDYKSKPNSGSGPSSWFGDLSMTQTMMWLGVAWLGVQLFTNMVAGGAA